MEVIACLNGSLMDVLMFEEVIILKAPDLQQKKKISVTNKLM